MRVAIEIEHLTHRYIGTDFNALDDLNLRVETGSIFGILGPNGAGKTTLISILTGYLKHHHGHIKILDYPLSNRLYEIQSKIGVVPQEYALYPTLTAKENLQFFGSMYGIPHRNLVQEIERGIEKMGLSKFANKRIDTFSGGMKRRINLLAGVLHRPQLIFLDEPTVGVDVHSKRYINSYLIELNNQGTTIVYSSHILHEAQTFCTEVVIMDSGKIKLRGKIPEILVENGKTSSLEELFIANTLKDTIANG